MVAAAASALPRPLWRGRRTATCPWGQVANGRRLRYGGRANSARLLRPATGTPAPRRVGAATSRSSRAASHHPRHQEVAHRGPRLTCGSRSTDPRGGRSRGAAEVRRRTDGAFRFTWNSAAATSHGTPGVIRRQALQRREAVQLVACPGPSPTSGRSGGLLRSHQVAVRGSGARAVAAAEEERTLFRARHSRLKLNRLDVPQVAQAVVLRAGFT